MKKTLGNIWNFLGLTQDRIGRRKFLIAFLTAQWGLPLVVLLVMGLFYVSFGEDSSLLFLPAIALFASLIFGVVVYIKISIRRVRDIGIAQGWWVLAIIPLINIPFFVYLCLKEGGDGRGIVKSTKLLEVPFLKYFNKQNNIPVIIGVVILAIILFFVFLNKPYTEQKENLRDVKKTNITNLLSWKEFISPDNQFKILFPGNPKHETEKPSDNKASSIIQYDFYTYKVNEGMAYFVNSAIFSSTINSPDSEVALKGFLNDELASNQELKLISSNITSFNGYTALDFFVEDKTTKYKGRDIILRNIRYQLMVVYNDENFNQNDYHKFINSFAFLAPEDKLRAQIKKYFSKESLSPQIIEIKVEDGTSGKIVLVKYSRHKNSTYLFDDAEGIYKAIFTYGEKVQKAVIEQYFLSFEDKYGNRCELLAWSSKIDNPTTIAKVNWEKISESTIYPWWEETHIFDLDAVCK